MCSIIHELWSAFICSLKHVARGSCVLGIVLCARDTEDHDPPCPQGRYGLCPFCLCLCGFHAPLYALCLSRGCLRQSEEPEDERQV